MRVFCAFYFPVRPRIVFAVKKAPAGLFRQKKRDRVSTISLCWRYLFSQAVTHQVSSTNLSLTSVFGMGTGGPSSQSTPTLQDCILKTEHSFGQIMFSKVFQSLLFRSSPRHISIGQLNALPRLHLRPINVIVYDVPYSFRMGDLILGGVSRLDAFSVYLVQT